MPSQPKKTNVDTPVSVPGMQIRNIEFKSIEDEQEKTLRLHKERVGFYVKEIGTWLLGFFFVMAIGFFCFWVLVHNDSALAEKDWARSGLTAILGGIVGFLFGKAAK